MKFVGGENVSIIGIELTADDRLRLEKVQRKLKVEKILDAAAWCMTAGLEVFERGEQREQDECSR